MKTPCGHGFHGACLAKWQTDTNACPVCRAAVDPSRPTRTLRCESDADDRATAMRILANELFERLFEDEGPGEEIIGQCYACERFIYDGEAVLHCTHCGQMNYCTPLCRSLDFRRHHNTDCIPHVRCPGCREWVTRDSLLACSDHCGRPACKRSHASGHANTRKRPRTEGL